jgi:hypothetical protein
MAFVGNPPLGLWRPRADEVHVSVTFTWDIAEGKRLAAAWADYYPNVRIGGPAFDDPGNGFVPGQYVKHGVTFTSRGCDHRCPWCLAWKREGRLAEIKGFAPGHIIQDNNILQTSKYHLQEVADMLYVQPRAAVFSGGIQASLVDTWAACWFEGLRVKELFLAADTAGALPALRRAVDKLEFLGRNSNKLRCYVMIGYGGETIDQARERLEAVWEAGCMPFAQLYRAPDRKIRYSKEWRNLARTWSRPAAIRAMHK